MESCCRIGKSWKSNQNHGNKQSGVALELSSSVISFEREKRRARLCEFSMLVKMCLEEESDDMMKVILRSEY